MIRVVHLLQPETAGDEGVLACAAALRDRCRGVEQSVVLLGNAADERRAWALGVQTTDRVSASGSVQTWRAPRSLRRLLNDRTVGEFTRSIIQSWCVPSLRAAKAAMPVGADHVGFLLRHPSESETTRSKQTHAALRGTTLACCDASIAEAYGVMRQGLSPSWIDRVRVLDVPRLGLTPSADRRTAIREHLGVDEATPIIFMLADPPERADALAFTFRLGLLHTTGWSSVGLVRRGAVQARRAARFIRANGRRWGLLESELPLTDLLAAADVAFVDGYGPAGEMLSCGPIALHAAAERGVPVVGPRCEMLVEHLGAAAESLMISSRAMSAGVAELLRVLEDHEFSAGVRAALRTHARRSCSRHTLAALWHEVANASAESPADVPEPEPDAWQVSA